MNNAVESLRSSWMRKFWWCFWLLLMGLLTGLAIRCAISPDLWVLLSLVVLLLGGLFVGSSWTTWLAGYRRALAVARFAEACGGEFERKPSCEGFHLRFQRLPLLQKGATEKIENGVLMRDGDLQIQVVDFEYAGASYTFATPTGAGGIQTGRNQTVLLWQNPPDDLPDMILEPRGEWLKKISSAFIGDALDYQSLGMRELTDPSQVPFDLARKYRIWIRREQRNVSFDEAAVAELAASDRPWVVEKIGSTMAIYQIGWVWPSRTYGREFAKAKRLVEGFRHWITAREPGT